MDEEKLPKEELEFLEAFKKQTTLEILTEPQDNCIIVSFNQQFLVDQPENCIKIWINFNNNEELIFKADYIMHTLQLLDVLLAEPIPQKQEIKDYILFIHDMISLKKYTNNEM